MRGPDISRTCRARRLRQEGSSAERIIWRALRSRQLAEFKFVRQHPIGPYFADFACRSHKLIVEIDGATHASDEQLARDAHRDSVLQRLGYRVLRFQNTDVYESPEAVAETILSTLQPSA